jgi:hypothetical protein
MGHSYFENGSIAETRIPLSYVETSVAKFATFCNDEYSSNRLSSRVRTRDCNRSAQNLFMNGIIATMYLRNDIQICPTAGLPEWPPFYISDVF